MTGMKDGSSIEEGPGSDPFADDDSQEMASESGPTTPTDTDSESDDATDRISSDELPYKLRRDRVNEERDHKPFPLRPETDDRLDAFVERIDGQLEDDVPRSDVLEAIVLNSLDDPAGVVDTLRSDRFGFDW